MRGACGEVRAGSPPDCVTGDSAGGHPAAVASLMPNLIGSRGFGRTPGVFEFIPSYLPKGKTIEQGSPRG